MIIREIVISSFRQILTEKEGLNPVKVTFLAKSKTTLQIFASMFQFFVALQVMAFSFLRGWQDTRFPMVITVISYWLIGIPISYILGFVFDYRGIGIWLGLVVGLAIVALLLWSRFNLLTRSDRVEPYLV